MSSGEQTPSSYSRKHRGLALFRPVKVAHLKCIPCCERSLFPNSMRPLPQRFATMRDGKFLMHALLGERGTTHMRSLPQRTLWHSYQSSSVSLWQMFLMREE